MKKQKLYFSEADSTLCHTLEDQLEIARSDGLAKITLIEAIPTKGNDYVWCKHYAETTEKEECTKANCSQYNSKSGRGVCADRGTLYAFGEEIEFEVSKTIT